MCHLTNRLGCVHSLHGCWPRSHMPMSCADICGDMSVRGGAGLLHTDFMHLAGSLLPWAALAGLLELNYGSARVILLWLVSLLGGAFTSAVLDPPCHVVRGHPSHAPLSQICMPPV